MPARLKTLRRPSNGVIITVLRDGPTTARTSLHRRPNRPEHSSHGHHGHCYSPARRTNQTQEENCSKHRLRTQALAGTFLMEAVFRNNPCCVPYRTTTTGGTSRQWRRMQAGLNQRCKPVPFPHLADSARRGAGGDLWTSGHPLLCPNFDKAKMLDADYNVFSVSRKACCCSKAMAADLLQRASSWPRLGTARHSTRCRTIRLHEPRLQTTLLIPHPAPIHQQRKTESLLYVHGTSSRSAHPACMPIPNQNDNIFSTTSR